MRESTDLSAARQHLERAESQFATEEGLAQLETALDLLDGLIGEPDMAERSTARNLAATYATRIFEAIQELIANDRTVPQPTLEHCFKLMLAFDAGDFELPAHARALKIAVVRRLIDLSYEGYPPEQKKAALERLKTITDT